MNQEAEGVWVHHKPSEVTVRIVGHPTLGGRYCVVDGADWPCATARQYGAALAPTPTEQSRSQEAAPAITDDPDYFPSTDYERGYADARAEPALDRLANALIVEVVTALRLDGHNIDGRVDGAMEGTVSAAIDTALATERVRAALAPTPTEHHCAGCDGHDIDGAKP